MFRVRGEQLICFPSRKSRARVELRQRARSWDERRTHRRSRSRGSVGSSFDSFKNASNFGLGLGSAMICSHRSLPS